MQRFYDVSNDRLIYLGKAATEGFWDDHWNTHDLRLQFQINRNRWRKRLRNFLGLSHNSVVAITIRYLETGSMILEGGCGLGQNLVDLSKEGFVPMGIDFAPQTVKKIKKAFPELEIRLGDVRDLPLNDSTVDGYWSLGVIEHFWEGFDSIAKEMGRVIRGGGYLFLTFPHMSWLRKQKVRFNQYDLFQSTDNPPDNFYQFALEPLSVANSIEEKGFTLVASHSEDGLKGFKDEVSISKPILQKLYNSRNWISIIIKFILEPLLKPLAGHMSLMVFRRNEH